MPQRDRELATLAFLRLYRYQTDITFRGALPIGASPNQAAPLQEAPAGDSPSRSIGKADPSGQMCAIRHSDSGGTPDRHRRRQAYRRGVAEGLTRWHCSPAATNTGHSARIFGVVQPLTY